MKAKTSDYIHITRLLQQRHFAEADLLLNKSPELSAEERAEYLGNKFFYLSDYEKAFQVYKDIFSSFPDACPARYYYLVAVQMERQQKYRDAFDYYRSSIEIEPTFVDAYIELAGLLVKIDDFEGAVKCSERALEFDPMDIRIYANLRILYRDLAEQKPEQYKLRSDQLEADYPRLEAELGPVPKGYKW